MHFNSVKTLNEHINSIHNHFFLLDSNKPFYTFMDILKRYMIEHQTDITLFIVSDNANYEAWVSYFDYVCEDIDYSIYIVNIVSVYEITHFNNKSYSEYADHVKNEMMSLTEHHHFMLVDNFDTSTILLDRKVPLKFLYHLVDVMTASFGFITYHDSYKTHAVLKTLILNQAIRSRMAYVSKHFKPYNDFEKRTKKGVNKHDKKVFNQLFEHAILPDYSVNHESINDTELFKTLINRYCLIEDGVYELSKN